MVAGGKPRHYLEAVRARYPLAMHGVSLSIGSTDPLDRDYLRALKRLMQEIEPVGDLIYGSEMSSGSGRFKAAGAFVPPNLAISNKTRNRLCQHPCLLV